MCFTGITGNVLSFIVLGQERQSRETIFLLRCLCVADIILLVSCISLMCLSVANVPMHPAASVPGELGRLLSIGMTVLIAAMRFAVMKFPSAAKDLVTMRRVRLAVITVTVMCTGLMVLFYTTNGQIDMQMKYVTSNHSMKNVSYNRFRPSCLANDKFIPYFITIYVLPMLLLVFFNIGLIRAYRARRVEQVGASSVREDGRQMTLMMIAIIVVFLLCQLTYTLGCLFRVFNDSSVAGIIGRASAFLLPFNSSVNFLIYFIIRRKFRDSVKQLWCCMSCISRRQERDFSISAQLRELI